MLVLCLLFTTCLLFWWWSRRPRSSQEPPDYPGALPLVGHLHLTIGDNVYFWTLLKKLSYDCLKSGYVAVTYAGMHKIYLITDPDDCLTVTNACLQKNFIYDFAKSWLGNGLITATVPVWKQHRKLLNPTFNQQVLYGYMEVFNSQARRLVDIMATDAGRGPFDHLPYVQQNALETICMTAMGMDFGDDKILNSKYFEAVDGLLNIYFQRFQKPWLHLDYFFKWSKLKNSQDKCISILHNVSNEVLQRQKAAYKQKMNDRKETEKKLETKCKPFLELLLELSEEQRLLTDEEVRQHVDTVIVSGYETVACVLIFTIILIGSYPLVQERLIMELQEVFDNTERDVAKQDLSRLVYLEAVIKESLRVYTVVPVFARHVDRDVKLKNYTLSAGNTCYLLLHGVHRHPMWGADVEEFKPERWLDPSTLPDNPNAFFAFSLGRRQCIGKIYAMMSLKTTLVHFLRRYSIKADHTKMAIKMDSLLKPVSGHHICIEERSFVGNAC